jgi:hypothetical protein
MADKNLRFYTTEKLGKKRELTPEGFLICFDVPIARTGQMIYGPDETPIKANADGYVRIEREPEEVFRPETIASYAGKPVTNDHPPEDVTPDNWKQYDVGTVLNPRRGTGAEDDLLIADLLIKDPQAIKDVLDGKREVSAGYDADYEETGEGRGRQRNIIANHVALVEEGRCGPRCAIGDRSFKPSVLEKSKMKINDFLRRAFKAKDEKELEEIARDAEGSIAETGSQHVHVHLPAAGSTTAGMTDEEAEEARKKKEAEDRVRDAGDLEGRIGKLEEGHTKILGALEDINKKLSGARDEESEEERKKREEKEAKDRARDNEVEGELEEEAPAGTGDAARKARDSAYLEDSFQETVALAEILAPGIRIPTFDRKSDPKSTLDTICKLRRNALDLAYVQPDTRGFIDEANGGKAFDIKNMSCGAVRTLFRSVAAMKKASNNGARGTHDTHRSSAGPLTLAEINRRNRERFKDA